MRKFALFLFASIMSASLLTACGGGSSGGAGSFAGTYSGTFNITVSIPGGPSDSVSGSTTVVINEDGTVVVDPGTPGEFSGTISGNTFTASFPGSDFNEPGFTCTGTVTMTGNGSGDTFTGTFSGTIVCNGTPIQVSGTFTVTRVDSASRGTIGVVEQLREAVK